jgi:hypothetical protein
MEVLPDDDRGQVRRLHEKVDEFFWGECSKGAVELHEKHAIDAAGEDKAKSLIREGEALRCPLRCENFER